jgi:hypothetical protein
MAEARRPLSSDRIAPMGADPTPYSKLPHPRCVWVELRMGGPPSCANRTYSGSLALSDVNYGVIL